MCEEVMRGNEEAQQLREESGLSMRGEHLRRAKGG